MIAVIAKEFRQLPNVVRDSLENDPEQLATVCLPLLRYADAHGAYRRANKQELKSWRDNPMMKTVEQIDADFVREEMDVPEDQR